MERENKKIIFYDGDCGFCNRSVQFILKNRTHNNFIFTPLQSNFAKEKLGDKNITIDLSTLYVMVNNEVLDKSDAGLSLVKDLKWYFKFLYIGYLLPKKWRDKVYDFVANRRMKIAPGFCYMPEIEEKKMFVN